MNKERRGIVLAFFSLVPGACSSTKPPASNRSCAQAGSGPGLPYCLVGDVSIVFPDARSLLPGEALIRAVDDNSAAVLMRDDQGFFALSATCPHACCTVSLCAPPACASTTSTPNDCAAPYKGTFATQGATFLCPCHGSEFGADGSVLQGPARSGLPAVLVTLGETDAVVDLTQAVTPTTRAS